MTTVRMIGIDPGTASCGLVVIDTDTTRHKLVKAALFESESDDASPDRLISDTRIDRARLLRQWFKGHMLAWVPDVVVTEEFTFLQSSHASAMLGLAVMAIVSVADDARIPVIAASAGTWRKDLAGLAGSGKGLTLSARRKRTKEREGRAHLEACRRVDGSGVIEAAWTVASKRAHVYDALGLACWGTTHALVQGLAR